MITRRALLAAVGAVAAPPAAGAALSPAAAPSGAPAGPLTGEEARALELLREIGAAEALDRLTLSGRYRWVKDAVEGGALPAELVEATRAYAEAIDRAEALHLENARMYREGRTAEDEERAGVLAEHEAAEAAAGPAIERLKAAMRRHGKPAAAGPNAGPLVSPSSRPPCAGTASPPCRSAAGCS
jgi:hypothetical protein